MAQRAEDIFEVVAEDDSDVAPPSDGAPRTSPIGAVVVTTLLAASVAVGLVLTYRLGVLPTAWFAGAVAADVIIASALAYGLFRSPLPAKRGRFIALTVLAVVAMVANLAVGKVSSDVDRALAGVQAPPTVGVRYHIVGLVDGPAIVTELDGTQMGDLATDENAEQARTAVRKLVSVQSVDYPDSGALTDALFNGDVTSIVLMAELYNLYREADPSFQTTTRIIATFAIEVPHASGTPQPTTPGVDTPTTPGVTTPGVTTPTTPGVTRPTYAPNPPGTFIVYISGIDTYGPITTRSRSDVNQLMVVNTNTGRIQLINTPRDYYVQLNGTTGLKDKLTHAGIYGIDKSKNTMQDLYGITIDYYIRVNFDSVITLVDAVGGIDVVSEVAFTTGNLTVVKGLNHFNGRQALSFSRERYKLAGGDRQRGKDQQAVITAVLKKLQQPSVLVNYNRILDAVQGCAQTSMPADVIAGFARTQLANGTSWDIQSYAVDGSNGSAYTYSMPGLPLYVMIPDQNTVKVAKQKIAETLAG